MSLWVNKSFKPMLLAETEKAFNSSDYLYEMKFDGYRAIIYAQKNSVQIFSRNNNDITYLFPELQNIKNLVKSNTIFDGEIVVFDNGKPSFKKMQQRGHLKNIREIIDKSINDPVVFMCFDILYKNKDLINLNLIQRKKILNSIKDNDYFIKVKYIEYEGIKLFKQITKLNLEGIVAKEKNSIYEINKRTNNWIKIKIKRMEEFVVWGFIYKKRNITLLLAQEKNEYLITAGSVSILKENNFAQTIKSSEIIAKGLLTKKNAVFIKPTRKCLVKFSQKTASNQLRDPIFIRFI